MAKAPFRGGRPGLTSSGPPRHGPAPADLAKESFKMTPGFTVIRDDTPAAAIPKGAVVAMGNFDGVHLGHRAVIDGRPADGPRP